MRTSRCNREAGSLAWLLLLLMHVACGGGAPSAERAAELGTLAHGSRAVASFGVDPIGSSAQALAFEAEVECACLQIELQLESHDGTAVRLQPGQLLPAFAARARWTLLATIDTQQRPIEDSPHEEARATVRFVARDEAGGRALDEVRLRIGFGIQAALRADPSGEADLGRVRQGDCAQADILLHRKPGQALRITGIEPSSHAIDAKLTDLDDAWHLAIAFAAGPQLIPGPFVGRIRLLTDMQDYAPMITVRAVVVAR